MPMYSYKCQSCGSRFDELVRMDDRHTCTCNKCRETAQQVITPVHFDAMSMGTDPSMPTFADKFERQMLQQKRKEEKAYKEHGDYGPAPGA